MEVIKKHWYWFVFLVGVMLISGVILILFSLDQPIKLIVDGELIPVKSLALTPAGIIKAAGYDIQAEDQVIPKPNSLFWYGSVIYYKRALAYTVEIDNKLEALRTTEHLPANILQTLGVSLHPKDQVIYNGLPIDPSKPIKGEGEIYLQYIPAKTILVDIDGQEIALYSSQPTLGMALDEAGIAVSSADILSKDLDIQLHEGLTLTIQRAKSVRVEVDNQQIDGISARRTVGEVLVELGIGLQDLDFSIPAENETLPADGKITVVRVHEAIVLEKEEFPFENTYEPDPNTELDAVSVLVPGQVGMNVSRERIRYHDDEEVARIVDECWKASDPKDGVLGYGTNVVVRTETVYGETIEYWRKVSVYATSYAPKYQGGAYTGSTSTASGMKLTKGVIAVTRAWYNAMLNQRVFVPGYGYGIIADMGGGIPGTPWIDLGFDDDNYESWHSWTIMYFLTPVPGYVPALLP